MQLHLQCLGCALGLAQLRSGEGIGRVRQDGNVQVIVREGRRSVPGEALSCVSGLSQPLIGEEFLGMPPLLGPNLWDREVATDLAREAVGDFRVPRHRLNSTGLWIAPQGMGTSLTLEVTSMPPQMLEQTAPLHPDNDRLTDGLWWERRASRPPGGL